MTRRYTNKGSMSKQTSRYNGGGTTDVFEKRLGWWERNIDIERNEVTDTSIKLTKEYERRPDLVAFDYYGDETLFWIILQYNNIVDVNEEFIYGKNITIPAASRLRFDILIT